MFYQNLICLVLVHPRKIHPDITEKLLTGALRVKSNKQTKKNLSKMTPLNKVSKGAKMQNRYNQVPHLSQDTNGKVTNSQLDTTNESQEVSPFPAGDHKAHINRRAQRHRKHKTEKKNIKDPQKTTLETEMDWYT